MPLSVMATEVVISEDIRAAAEAGHALIEARDKAKRNQFLLPDKCLSVPDDREAAPADSGLDSFIAGTKNFVAKGKDVGCDFLIKNAETSFAKFKKAEAEFRRVLSILQPI